MLSANKEKLQSFFMGNNQFKIPFFQRSYVWKMENWSELWDSIKEELEAFQEDPEASEHFIGTIIIKQTNSEKLGALIYDLIDGQQRLTTLCILLRAMYDSAQDESLKKWIYKLIVFEDSYGNENIRIVHSKIDKGHFERIILGNDSNNDLWEKNKNLNEKEASRLNNIDAAYVYFRNRIEEEIQPEEQRDFVTVLLEKLPVIHMALSKEDDVQQIFDTINSLGVKLTTAELLKNHLYSFDKVEPYYKEYWSSVFEADEDVINFWNTERSSGRVKRTTVELFLYSFLVIKKESVIRIESLFKEFKNYLKDESQKELIAFAKELSEYALLYMELPDGENLSEFSYQENEKRFMHVIRELEITTAFPLVLFLYKEVNDADELSKIIKILESYLIRRTICRLTTKNYNNLFISLLKDLKKKTITAKDFREKLLTYDDDSSRFPSDDEVKVAIHNKYLINRYSREVLYCISLHQLDNGYQDNGKLNFDGFSVEHIMPKKWRNNWQLSNGFTEEERDYKLLTLGNLTLIRGKLNSSLRDSDWFKKKGALTKYSTLPITTDYLQEDEWNEEVIEKRGNDLYAEVVKVWPK